MLELALSGAHRRARGPCNEKLSKCASCDNEAEPQEALDTARKQEFAVSTLGIRLERQIQAPIVDQMLVLPFYDLTGGLPVSGPWHTSCWPKIRHLYKVIATA